MPSQLCTVDRLGVQVKVGLFLSYEVNKIKRLIDHIIFFVALSTVSCIHSVNKKRDSLPQLYTFGKND